MKNLLTLFLLISAFQISFGQKYEYDDDNWLGEMGYPTERLTHIYPNKIYTKEDVSKAKAKFSLIKNSTLNDEWEGFYRRWEDLSQIGLIWQKESGFVQYYIYTCAIELRGVWFGNTITTSDKVKLNYEKPLHYFYPKKKVINQENLIKVKIGEKLFLVPENRLREFCEYVAGLRQYFESEIQGSYWWKVSNTQEESNELPTLPQKYSHFLVQPVKGQIIKVGKRTIQRSKNWEGKIEVDGIRYSITLNVGSRDKVRENVEFYIPEINETAIIEKVFSNSSIASILREVDETNNDKCLNTDNKKIECPKISVGMLVKTRIISP